MTIEPSDAHARTTDVAQTRLSTPPFTPVRERFALHPKHASAIEPLSAIDHYTWFARPNWEQATTWCLAAVAAQRIQDVVFFVEAITDLYCFDRAEKAVAILNYSGYVPIRTADIPKMAVKTHTIPDGSGRGWSEQFELSWRKLEWTQDTPKDAVSAVGRIVAQAPPDLFLIADYKKKEYTFDPIIFARYGTWNVELYRWD